MVARISSAPCWQFSIGRVWLDSHLQLSTENEVHFIDIYTSVRDCINDLKLRRPTGHDDISNEQIIYGGSQLVAYLSLLFDAMLRQSWYVRNDFRLGNIIKLLLKCISMAIKPASISIVVSLSRMSYLSCLRSWLLYMYIVRPIKW